MSDEQEETYPLPSETMSSLSWNHHLGDLLRMRDICESFGIQTRNTRLDRYEKFLRRYLDGYQSGGEAVFQIPSKYPFENCADCMLYVLREVHELMWILKGIQVNPPKGIKEKLDWIVSGRDFAFLDADSRSRDTQFELRIASYFSQAGFTVDLTSETDVISHSDNYVYYIECKRIGSTKKLRKRLSDAKSQLRLRMPKRIGRKLVFGCVAADVTKVAFDHNGLTFGGVADHSKDVIQKKLKEICKNAESFDLFNGEKNLIVYWFQIHISALVMFPQTLTSRFSSNQIFRSPLSRKQARAAHEFYCNFSNVSVNDSRSNPPKVLRKRTNVTLHEGTKFYMNEQLIGEMIHRQKIAHMDDDFVVGGMEIDGIETSFSFLEFIQALECLEDDERDRMVVEDPVWAQAVMIAIMWGRRNP